MGKAFAFLWAPLLYLYICSLTTNNYSINRKLIPHFIPFAGAFIFLIFTLYIHNTKPTQYILNISNTGFNYNTWHVLYNIQILIYMAFAIIRLHRFAKQLKYNYANINKINLKWLRVLLYSYVVAWLISVFYHISQRIFANPPEFLTVLLFLFFLVFFNIIVFKALTTPKIFSTIDIPLKEKRKSLSANKAKLYLEKLETYTQEHKPYLSSTINLNELAEMVDIPPRSLSEVLNDALNQSFFDYINCYRINEAEQLLLNSKDPSLTVSEIIYDVGFNSKSAFYNAFKKYKGYSPTQLKRVRNTASST